MNFESDKKVVSLYKHYKRFSGGNSVCIPNL